MSATELEKIETARGIIETHGDEKIFASLTADNRRHVFGIIFHHENGNARVYRNFDDAVKAGGASAQRCHVPIGLGMELWLAKDLLVKLVESSQLAAQ